MIPLQDLRLESEQNAFLGYAQEKLKLKIKNDPNSLGVEWDVFQAEFQRIVSSLPFRKYSDARSDRQAISDFVTSQIYSLVSALGPTRGHAAPFVEVDPGAQCRVELLKELNWYYVINKPALGLMQEGQQKLTKGLFEGLFYLL